MTAEELSQAAKLQPLNTEIDLMADAGPEEGAGGKQQATAQAPTAVAGTKAATAAGGSGETAAFGTVVRLVGGECEEEEEEGNAIDDAIGDAGEATQAVTALSAPWQPRSTRTTANAAERTTGR